MMQAMTLGSMRSLAEMLVKGDALVNVSELIESATSFPSISASLDSKALPYTIKLVTVEITSGLQAPLVPGEQPLWDVDCELVFEVSGTSYYMFVGGARIKVGRESRFVFCDKVELRQSPPQPPLLPLDIPVASRHIDNTDCQNLLLERMWDDIRVDETKGTSLQQQLLERYPMGDWQQAVHCGQTIDGYMEWVLRQELRLPLTRPEEIDS